MQLTRSFASIPISPSNETVMQVRDFIKPFKEQIIKDWCVQFWSKAVRFGTSRYSQEELESVQNRTAKYVIRNYNYC